MSTGWVAASVRAHGLARRRLGDAGIEAVARSSSLDDALGLVAAGPYGRSTHPDMDLPDAQRAVLSSLLWHLRVLAGWGPPLSAGSLQALAGGFEIADVVEHLARLDGRQVPAPFSLGALSTAWPRVRRAESPVAVRAVLASSAWGDPGTVDPGALELALQLRWAARVADVPGAGAWARAGAALVVARVAAVGAVPELTPPARRAARRLLGSAWERATSLESLAAVLPRDVRTVFADVHGRDDLWRAEVAFVDFLEEGASRLARGPVTEPATSVGVAGLLVADAWRTAAALALAARTERSPEGLFDALA
ncbi:MAG: hypothetical protein KGJ77_00910 [Acidobacteriota bacterium]|nr:hypothetical protein [Acidobacteriota bacterium]